MEITAEAAQARKDCRKAYREAHKDHINEYQRSWRAAHRDEVNEKARQWRAANKDRIREYNRRYWAKKANAAGTQSDAT